MPRLYSPTSSPPSSPTPTSSSSPDLPTPDPLAESDPDHPADYFSVLRFGAEYGPAYRSQQIELCFHYDWPADEPVSIHFDRHGIFTVTPPPSLSVPSPPWQIVDAGTVHMVPQVEQLVVVDVSWWRQSWWLVAALVLLFCLVVGTGVLLSFSNPVPTGSSGHDSSSIQVSVRLHHLVSVLDLTDYIVPMATVYSDIASFIAEIRPPLAKDILTDVNQGVSALDAKLSLLRRPEHVALIGARLGPVSRDLGAYADNTLRLWGALAARPPVDGARAVVRCMNAVIWLLSQQQQQTASDSIAFISSYPNTSTPAAVPEAVAAARKVRGRLLVPRLGAPLPAPVRIILAAAAEHFANLDGAGGRAYAPWRTACAFCAAPATRASPVCGGGGDDSSTLLERMKTVRAAAAAAAAEAAAGQRDDHVDKAPPSAAAIPATEPDEVLVPQFSSPTDRQHPGEPLAYALARNVAGLAAAAHELLDLAVAAGCGCDATAAAADTLGHPQQQSIPPLWQGFFARHLGSRSSTSSSSAGAPATDLGCRGAARAACQLQTLLDGPVRFLVDVTTAQLGRLRDVCDMRSRLAGVLDRLNGGEWWVAARVLEGGESRDEKEDLAVEYTHLLLRHPAEQAEILRRELDRLKSAIARVEDLYREESPEAASHRSAQMRKLGLQVTDGGRIGWEDQEGWHWWS